MNTENSKIQFAATSPGQLRAEWKSEQHLQILRIENRCLRCEKKGCYAKICPLLPVKGISYKSDVPRPRTVLLGPHGKPLRARWKNVEQIERLKLERRCYRCERLNCCTKNVPFYQP